MAMVPLRQLEQQPVTQVCEKRAGVQARVVWQLSHDAVVGT